MGGVRTWRSICAPTAPCRCAAATVCGYVLSWRSPRKYQRNERGLRPSTPRRRGRRLQAASVLRYAPQGAAGGCSFGKVSRSRLKESREHLGWCCCRGVWLGFLQRSRGEQAKFFVLWLCSDRLSLWESSRRRRVRGRFRLSTRRRGGSCIRPLFGSIWNAPLREILVRNNDRAELRHTKLFATADELTPSA